MTASAKTGLFLLVGCGALLGAVPPAFGDAPRAALKFVSAQDLAAAVATPPSDPFAKEIATDPSATTLIIRRDRSGEVEVHTNVNDIIVVRSGRATVIVGGQVTGNHALKPTEWRGGEIVGGESHELAAGDLLLIPAGVPHQCIVKPGTTFIYSTIKTPSAAAAP